VAPTRHTRTNAEVIQLFVEAEVRMQELGQGIWRIVVR
jgi:hypothetical protein